VTRNSACLAPILLLALLLCPACSTTTQRSAAAISLCVASFAADVAILVASHASVDTVGFLGFVGCEAGEAALRSAPTSEHAELPQREATNEPPK
jgi:hypothetical protein